MSNNIGEACDELYKYHVDEPYPEIEVERKNPKYANIILYNYASAVSEFTAINQYIFHHMVLEEKYNDISDTLRGIAIVEMHHLDILGDLTIALGKEPRYHYFKKHKPVNWTPKFIKYSTNASEAIKDDIASEIDAICQYKQSLKDIDDSNIKAIISRIILDEEFHIELFRGLQRKYSLV